MSYLLLLLPLLSANCGDKGQPVTPTLPTVSISSIAPFEGESSTTVSFKVTLSAASEQAVTVDYATSDGTAATGTDYIAKTGKLTINPKSTEGVIEITVVGDTLKEADEDFRVTISNPTNATLGTSTGVATIRNDDTYIFIPTDGYITPEDYTGYERLWRDEFEGTRLDSTIWGFDIGTGNWGWGNNELQYYTNRPENVYLDAGKLIIQARKESYSGSAYTSARLNTKNKKEFLFGRVDIRAKLPKGQGIWPALWSLGKKIDQVGWPNCGEMDIMEVLGHEPNKAHGTIHFGPQGSSTSTQRTASYTLPTGNFSEKFNVFSLVWSADNIEILVNDISFFRTTRTQVGSIYPFNEPFYMLLNVAVGGNWPGAPNASTVFPQQMAVDYVRVFRKL